MGERKVLNKYYPPDFDPSLIPRRKMSRDRQFKVRLMAPFNMRCTGCGEYVYKGKKFNSTKETVMNEEYLGLKIFRFYIRCPKCSNEIAFKTDPRNADYICEIGATRNFEHWRVHDKDVEAEEKAKEEEEEMNPMAALENRTRESRQEMDILDALEEIKDANARNAQIDLDALIQARSAEEQDKLAEAQEMEEELDADDAMVHELFANRGRRLEGSSEEEDEDGADNVGQAAKRTKTTPSSDAFGKGGAASTPTTAITSTAQASSSQAAGKASTAAALPPPAPRPKIGGLVKLKSPAVVAPRTTASPAASASTPATAAAKSAPPKAAQPAAPAALGMIAAYGDSDED